MPAAAHPHVEPAEGRASEATGLEAFVLDKLTGLYNGEALRFLGSYHARLAERTRAPLGVIYLEVVDPDGKAVDETDETLCETAELLHETFRASDVCARLEGNAFAVLLSEVARGRIGLQIALLRLLERHEAKGRSEIVYRTGVAAFEPGHEESFGDLLARARANAIAMSAATALAWARSLARTPDEVRLVAEHLRGSSGSGAEQSR
jgi:diguanylate cyclase (GGDEF)-like protein